jgi:glycopeptide antibiotics resistance protein
MMAKKREKWLAALFAAYGLMMLWLLFGQRWGQNAGGLNLEPFHTLRLFWWVLENSHQPEQLRHAVVNLGGNVAMFVPLGFFVPCIWKKMGKIGWHFLCMVLIILAVELLQLATGLGTCDVDDLILNLVGTAIGFGLYKLWKYVCRRGGS